MPTDNVTCHPHVRIVKHFSMRHPWVWQVTCNIQEQWWTEFWRPQDKQIVGKGVPVTWTSLSNYILALIYSIYNLSTSLLLAFSTDMNLSAVIWFFFFFLCPEPCFCCGLFWVGNPEHSSPVALRKRSFFMYTGVRESDNGSRTTYKPKLIQVWGRKASDMIRVHDKSCGNGHLVTSCCW